MSGNADCALLLDPPKFASTGSLCPGSAVGSSHSLEAMNRAEACLPYPLAKRASGSGSDRILVNALPMAVCLLAPPFCLSSLTTQIVGVGTNP